MKYTYYERAWIEDILGEIWFREHFVKCCGTERPQVLILDSHSAHETLGLLETAKKEGIHLFAFLSHTTQWLELSSGQDHQLSSGPGLQPCLQ